MTAEEIQAAIRKGPPFVIKTVDGDLHDGIDQIMVGQNTVVFFAHAGPFHVFETERIASITQKKFVTIKMNSNTLKEVAHAAPFVPFTIHLSDGREAKVPAPDFVNIGPTGRTVIVWTPEGAPRIISVGMITELSVEKAAD